VIAAALAFIGIVAFGIVVRRIEPIDWSITPSTQAGRRVGLPGVVIPAIKVLIHPDSTT
jgi:hypothetical protein